MQRRSRRLLLSLLLVAAAFTLLILLLDVQFPATPDIDETFTLESRPAPQAIGSWDVLGRTIDADEAAALRQTPEGSRLLSPEAGGVQVTGDLVALGRRAFYEETYGNEIFFTDVLGTIDGPINLETIGQAILALGGQPTSNLRVRLDDDATVGGRTWAVGTVLDTGLDVPAGSRIPLGMRVRLVNGRVKVGITCAACHSTVMMPSGRIAEGAPNTDLDAGLLLAFATNSAAFFRQTGADPLAQPLGGQTYVDSHGQERALPDPQALEDAADADFLAWPPGNFDSTGDLRNNPTQIPSSYTFGAWPYGWSGFASTGWFHGLTTLNNNVHATNSDATTGADSSPVLLGIDKETYLGVIFQNAARERYRLPAGERPSEFFARVDPTPGVPGMNRAVRMPGYPRGSLFILDGLMANTPGLPVAAQLNGMSVWQNTLSPPPFPSRNEISIRRGAEVFTRAGCGECHSGRWLTNNRVIPQPEVGTQPSRARALAAFPKIFGPPRTWSPDTPVPRPAGARVLRVPVEIVPKEVRLLAFAVDAPGGNPAGGYKVPSLIGLAVTAPYLHDGGVAAGPSALRTEEGRIEVADPGQLGLAGTLLRGITPDPAASLRVLVDRRLRAAVVAANRDHRELQRANADGSGHAYWVDGPAGFSGQDQDDLLQLLLSLDDDPVVLP